MSEKIPRITTIGFEGPNRVGKSTQSELLRTHLETHGIPVVIVRGDGSRSGLGKTEGDPESKVWQEIDGNLRTPGTDLEEWNRSSYRIARELLVWRDRILPNMAKVEGVSDAVLLVDRTLLARTLVPREMGTPERLYDDEMRAINSISGEKKGTVVTAEKVAPDIIIQFVAPKEVLLSRLEDSGDEKSQLRRRLLEERYGWYLDAQNYLPPEFADLVVRVDASEDPDSVFQTVLGVLNERGLIKI
jgi:thymidylate kinase